MHQPIRTQLDLLRPSCNEHVLQQQTKQQMQHDQWAKMRDFEVGDTVMIRNYRGKPKWFTGTILEKCAPVSYRVKTHSGLIWRRHVDKLRAVSPSITSNCDNNEALTDVPVLGGNQNNSADLVPDSGPLTHSTFADISCKTT